MRAVLWDMDGTIADSEETHFRAWQVSLEQYGITYSFEDFIADFGRSNSELLPDLLGVEPGAELVDRVSREKEATFRRLAREWGLQLLPGIAGWLERFRAEGVHQVVSSSGPMANIVASVDILGLGDYFVSLMSGATLPKSKPDPAIFLNSAAAVGAAPHECIVVEDSIHGVEGAMRAGMGSIAVGKVADNDRLRQLFESANGVNCLAARDMSDVTWEALDALWRKA